MAKGALNCSKKERIRWELVRAVKTGGTLMQLSPYPSLGLKLEKRVLSVSN
jgi:hypothetical protein